MGTDVRYPHEEYVHLGGVVENITLRNIQYESKIKGEAVILTMSYVLNSLNQKFRCHGK